MLVLNEDCPGVKEFGRDGALYFGFGSQLTTRNYQDKEKYMEDIAKVIISEFERNRVLKAFNYEKKFHNFDYVFKNRIEPLFYET